MLKLKCFFDGTIKGMGKSFVYIENPVQQARETEGQTKLPGNFSKELKDKEKLAEKMSDEKSAEVKMPSQKALHNGALMNECAFLKGQQVITNFCKSRL